MPVGRMAILTIEGVEIKSVDGFDLKVERAKVSAPVRGELVEGSFLGSMTVTASGKVRVDESAGSVKVMTTFAAGTAVPCEMLSGPASKADTWGIKGPFFVTMIGGPQNLNDPQYHDVALVPAVPTGTQKYQLKLPGAEYADL